jgi:oligoribonuclease NrnB/cAMP/cGMP phosphodiesterase (DHH superfamily)
MAKDKILCIYHRDCLDGFAAAWAVHRALGRMDPECLKYYPTTYGEPPPAQEMLQDAEVLIVDFSYPADTLKIIGEIAHSVVVLDHHEKAEKELREFRPLEFSFHDWTCKSYEPGIHVRFDMKQSGCGLTWRWAHKSESFDLMGDEDGIYDPDIVRYVEDRDLWLFKYGNRTKAFCAALGAQSFSFELWDQVCDDGLAEDLMRSGNIVLQAQAKMIEQALKPGNLQFFKIGGIEVPTFNISAWTGIVSEALNIAAKQSADYPFVASYSDGSDARYFSLRSDRDNPNAANVNLISNQYGGGGHPNAAGFKRLRGWLGDKEPLPRAFPLGDGGAASARGKGYDDDGRPTDDI